MNLLLAFILISLYLLIILWGLAKKERIYQYPFLVNVFSLVFIGPQIVALINSPGIYVTDEAIFRVLLMGCFCALASWFGYQITIPQKWLLKKPLNLNINKLNNWAVIYLIIGIAFNFLILFLPENEGMKINGQSSGMITILIFIMRGFLYIGFPLVLMKSLKKKTISNLILMAFALCIPFYHAIFLGKRSSAFLLIISICLSLYFVQRLLPLRSIAIAAIIFALIMNLNIREYRNMLITKDWQNINSIEFLGNANNYLSQGKILELRNAALMIDLTAKTGRLGWGTLYWDQLVFRFVPGQLIGRELKKKFQIKKSIEGNHLLNAYGYRKPLGTTPTGIGESFTQFDYFGALLYAFSGILCKLLYLRALTWKTPFSRVLYISVLQNSVLDTVVVGHSWFFCAFFTLIVFSVPLVFLCHQVRPHNHNTNYLYS